MVGVLSGSHRQQEICPCWRLNLLHGGSRKGMTTHELPADRGTLARSLRKSQTKSEAILWSVLRAKQVCGLKFRRQHPLGPWIVDFACVDKLLVIEIDGGYHDQTIENDLARQEYLQRHGWRVIRFTDQDVEKNAEEIAHAIARELLLPYEFKPRKGTASGMK